MRLTRLHSSRPGSRPAPRPAASWAPLARWSALLCLVGLVVGLVWPALALGQGDDDGEQESAEQGRRGTPAATATATATATASSALEPAAATPVTGLATPAVDGTPGANPVAAGASALQGVFSVGIGEADLPPGLPGAPALVGLWNLALEADGRYALSRQDVGPVAAGAYRVAGETLTFEDWTGVVSCTDAEGDSGATYAWQLTEDVLTLTPISDTCTDRTILFSTRTLGSFEACATVPLALPEAPASGPGVAVSGGPPIGPGVVGTPGATPVVVVAPDQGVPAGAEVEEAIDTLLRQATGCWATGDPTLFLPLHSQGVLAEFIAFPELITQLQQLMAQPVGFERVGGVNQLAPDRAWSYVEIAFGGELPFAGRFDYVQEEGAWLLDTFFLFPPADPNAPQPLP